LTADVQQQNGDASRRNGRQAATITSGDIVNEGLRATLEQVIILPSNTRLLENVTWGRTLQENFLQTV